MKRLMILVVFLITINLYGAYEYIDFGSTPEALVLQSASASSICGPSAVAINPAALGGSNKNWASVSYLNWIFDSSLESIEGGYSLNRYITFSAFLSYFSIKDFDLIDEFGDKISSIKYYDVFGLVGSGINIGSVDIGFNVKIFGTKLKYSGSGFSSDIGIRIPHNIKKFRASIVIKDLISDMPKLGKSGDSIPVKIILGTEYKLSRVINLLLSYRTDNQVNFGSNFNFSKKFRVSFGYGVGVINSWGIGMEYSFISESSAKIIELGILKPVTDMEDIDFPINLGFRYEF